MTPVKGIKVILSGEKKEEKRKRKRKDLRGMHTLSQSHSLFD